MKTNSNETLAVGALDDKSLLELESKYCSWGDTVHYAKELTFFREGEIVHQLWVVQVLPGDDACA